MRANLITKYNKVILYLLSILGIGGATIFSSCSKNNGNNNAMYGTPTATFKVMGQISSESQVKIPHLQVVMHYDTAYTDVNGNYQVEVSDFPVSQEYTLQVMDIDSTINGSYLPKDISVTFDNPQFAGGDGSWYAGQVSQEVNIQLEAEKE